MKTFNELLQESVGDTTIEKLLWPDGIYANDRDLAIANMHLVNRVEYPVEQRDADFPFKDNSIQHRTGYIGAPPVSDNPAKPPFAMRVEDVETVLALEITEEQKAKRDRIASEMKVNVPDGFEEYFGKDAARAIYALATQHAIKEEVVTTAPETTNVSKVKDLAYFTEVKETGSSDLEVTPKDEVSALTLAKKYDALAKSSDDNDLKESYAKASQRFFDTANRLRAFKRRRTGEPKQRLKESEFDDLVAMLEHVIASGDDFTIELDEETNESLEITPAQAGVLYNKINALNEEEQVAFVTNITESKETLEQAFLAEGAKAPVSPKHYEVIVKHTNKSEESEISEAHKVNATDADDAKEKAIKKHMRKNPSHDIKNLKATKVTEWHEPAGALAAAQSH